MKSMKIITLALLLAISLNKAKAQTKEETANWLVETISKYMKADTIHHFIKTENGWVEENTFTEYSPKRFEIRGDKFYITYWVINKSSVPKPKFLTPEERKWRAKAVYPVSVFEASASIYLLEKLITRQSPADNDSNKYTGGNYLAIHYNEKVVVTFSDTYEAIDLLPLFIDSRAEPGLVLRLQDALTRLKHYKT